MFKDTVTPPRSPPAIDDLDATLIQATLQGNQQSFAQLIQKHQPFIFLMVHRHLRQREEAEDVVQQVFFKAFQHLGNFRGDAKFTTWLYTIALNLVRNHVRQRTIRRTESLDVSATDGNISPQWPDKAPSIEKVVQDRWDMERIRAAGEKIEDPYRTIFKLHYFEHLALKDVALRVAIPAGTVKVYLQRARTMILNLVTS